MSRQQADLASSAGLRWGGQGWPYTVLCREALLVRVEARDLRPRPVMAVRCSCRIAGLASRKFRIEITEPQRDSFGSGIDGEFCENTVDVVFHCFLAEPKALRNRQILRTRDPAERQAYYDELKATADDPVRHKNYLMRSSLIQSLREAAATP